MDQFASLMLRASQAFGAPAQLARFLGCDPDVVYRWIAGLDIPDLHERVEFALRIERAVAELGKSALAHGRRRWVDHWQPA